MTRIFVFYHIIQNSLELKNELQWKKYHVYGGIHCILILSKNRGYLGFWKVSCHGVFFREGVWFFLHFLMNFYCTPLLKNHYLNTMMQKKMKYKYSFLNATFITDSVYPKIGFRVAGTRSVTTKRNNVNFNINPNLIEITGTWTWNGLSCLCVV